MTGSAGMADDKVASHRMAAHEDLSERVRQSACLAEASMLLLEAHTEERILDIATGFITVVLPASIATAHRLAEDGSSTVLRSISGVDNMIAEASDLAERELIGSSAAITDSFRANLETCTLRRVDQDFVEYAKGLLPVAEVERLEQLVDVRAMYVIGLADGGKSYGALHILFSEPPEHLPSDVIETFAHVCFLSLSQADGHRRRVLEAERNAEFLDHMLEGLAQCELLYDDSGTPVDYRYLSVNHAFSRLVGVPTEELRGRTRREVFGDADARLIELYAEVSCSGIPQTFKRRSEHLEKYIETTAYSPQPGIVITLSSDITDAHESYEALVRSEQKYAVAFQTSPDAIAITRRSDGTYLDCNDGFCALSGFSHDEVVGRTSAEIDVWADWHDRERMVGLLQAAGEVRDYAALFRRKDGSSFTGSMSARPMKVDGVDCLLSITRDISELEGSRARERRHSERLSAMASELAATETRERRTLAEELHDRVSQNLAVAKMQLDALLHEAGSDARPELVSAVSLLNGAIAESRSITFELAPPVLHELGLSSGLRWMAEEIRRTHGLKVHVDVEDGLDGCGEQASAFLVRALRELLVNVVKHAGVNEAWVTAASYDGMVRLTVEDRGLGYSLADREIDSGHKFGLFGLRNRVQYMRGRFKVETAPGKGARTTIALPVQEETSEA